MSLYNLLRYAEDLQLSGDEQQWPVRVTTHNFVPYRLMDSSNDPVPESMWRALDDAEKQLPEQSAGILPAPHVTPMEIRLLAEEEAFQERMRLLELQKQREAEEQARLRKLEQEERERLAKIRTQEQLQASRLQQKRCASVSNWDLQQQKAPLSSVSITASAATSTDHQSPQAKRARVSVLPQSVIPPTIPEKQPYILPDWPPVVKKRSFAYRVPGPQHRITGHCILYWVTATPRVRDNWALALAVYLSRKLSLPLVAMAVLPPVPSACRAQLCHASALAELHHRLADLNVPLIGLALSSASEEVNLLDYDMWKAHSGALTAAVNEFNNALQPHMIVTDESYHLSFIEWMKQYAKDLPCSLHSVDSNHLLPVRYATPPEDVAPLSAYRNAVRDALVGTIGSLMWVNFAEDTCPRPELQTPVRAALKEVLRSTEHYSLVDWSSVRASVHAQLTKLLSVLPQDTLMSETSSASQTAVDTSLHNGGVLSDSEMQDTEDLDVVEPRVKRGRNTAVELDSMPSFDAGAVRNDHRHVKWGSGFGESSALDALTRYFRDYIEPNFERDALHAEGLPALMLHVSVGTISAVHVLQAMLNRMPSPTPSARQAAVEWLCWRRECYVHWTYTHGEMSAEKVPLWAQEKLFASSQAQALTQCSLDRIEQACTDDLLFNQVQTQLVDLGWLHPQAIGYWAKRILAWMGDLPQAFEYSLALLQRYAILGGSPIVRPLLIVDGYDWNLAESPSGI
eukprot:TRINITY_DN15044_c0_g1_i1.p1 TRINITY_DN15044_c0_g1~~TRINITY_DN15044_c0_g1_i1.p1  ORF type:complete len:740 (+),score=152.48 TRINITY_DN15044_c0_g1_i1:1075-3294(+)